MSKTALVLLALGILAASALGVWLSGVGNCC
jgi:hypothetical protein